MTKQQKYEILEDLTSDIAFKAYGKTKQELLENSGEALLSIMADIDTIKPKKTVLVKVEGEDYNDLLFNWLQELIAVIEIEGIYFSSFSVKEFSKTSCIVECKGEPIQQKMEKAHIKAITRYLYSVKETKQGLTATVTVDV